MSALSDQIANDLIEDINERGGGDAWWHSIDSDVQEDIRAEWSRIIADAIAAEEADGK